MNYANYSGDKTNNNLPSPSFQNNFRSIYSSFKESQSPFYNNNDINTLDLSNKFNITKKEYKNYKGIDEELEGLRKLNTTKLDNVNDDYRLSFLTNQRNVRNEYGTPTRIYNNYKENTNYKENRCINSVNAIYPIKEKSHSGNVIDMRLKFDVLNWNLFRV